jgi:hypothetical protein
VQVTFAFQGAEMVVGCPGLDSEMGRHLPHRGRIALLLEEFFHERENRLLFGGYGLHEVLILYKRIVVK